jgi:hypothetical protein
MLFLPATLSGGIFCLSTGGKILIMSVWGTVLQHVRGPYGTLEVTTSANDLDCFRAEDPKYCLCAKDLPVHSGTNVGCFSET